MIRARQSRVWAGLFALAALAAALAGLAAWSLSAAALSERLDRALLLTARTIEAEIERFRYLPGLALEDPRIRAAVTAPENAARIDAANRALQVAAARSGADELYLLDEDGTTLASSNWQDASSFVGENYAFRPYFRDALASGAGRFYAVGVTTGEPGYFLASRARIGDRQAVMVVKVDLQPLQTGWAEAGGALAVVDRFGIVILSGAPDWLYHPLVPLDPEARIAIAAFRAYAELPVLDRPPLLASAADLASNRIDTAEGRRALRLRDLPLDDWRLIGSAPLDPAWRNALAMAGAAALVTVALGALALTWQQRRRLLALRLKQGRILETRVAERTEALAREIEERRRAEADLREAQDALIHSEKMAALGRMSTAIVHEISQPLAAMEASLAAAILSGKIEDEPSRRRIEKARGNIRRILRTIKHLKSFARKEAGSLRPVGVDEAIAGALDLVAPRAATSTAQIRFAPEGRSPVILAGQVRLEQVLVNLLMNALDATADHPAGQIEITRQQTGTRVDIAVRDNGAGIPPSLLARVTEPFFSTKAAGDGLGLGLSISRTIVEEFRGRLDLRPAPGGGTLAVVSFDLPDTGKAAA